MPLGFLNVLYPLVFLLWSTRSDLFVLSSEKNLWKAEHLAVKKADMFLRRQTSCRFIRGLKCSSNRMVMLLCKKNEFRCLVQNVIFRSDDDSTDVEWGGKHTSPTESDVDENVCWCSSKRMQSSPSFEWSGSSCFPAEPLYFLPEVNQWSFPSLLYCSWECWQLKGFISVISL